MANLDSAHSDPTTVAGTSTSRWRWGLFLCVIALVAGQGLAQINTATVKYSPTRWQEGRPPHTPMFSANDRSRWCTVWSLAEQGTYQIDEIIRRPGWDTIDKVYVNEHFYSSKPPFVAAVVSWIYRGVKSVTGYSLDKQTHEAVHTTLTLFNLVPWLIALIVVGRMLDHGAQTDIGRVVPFLTLALGTFATPFLITLNNHSPAICCLVFSMAPLIRIADGNRSMWRFAVAGFFAATCACCELPAAAWGLISFGIAVRADWKKTVALFIPAALIPLGYFLYSNWEATGGLMPTYASFGAVENNPYHYTVDGIPSYWMNPSAIDRGESSPGVYLFHCLFGHHGVFSLTPIFLLSIVSWMQWFWIRERIWKGIVACSLGLTVWVMAFYLLRTESYNYGGVTSGLRWAFWLIPLWGFATVPVLDRFGQARWFQVVTAILLGVSIYSSTVPSENPWQLPWLYERWNVWFPTPKAEVSEKESYRSWLISPPTELDTNGKITVRYTAVAIGGGTMEFSLRFERSADGDDTLCTAIGTLPGFVGTDLESISPLNINVSEFDPNQDAAKQAARLVGSTREKDPKTIAATRFLRGLPAGATYTVDPKPKYLKSRLQTEAFECKLIAASVMWKPTPESNSLRYRRIVWWTDKLPFGAIQIEDTIADPVDNSVIARQRWRVAEVTSQP